MASRAALELLIELQDNASKGLGSIGGSLRTVGAIAGGIALGGVAAFGAALVSGIGDAREAAKVYAQTEQVIKSTGGAAGFSAQQIKDMAGSLSAASGQSLFGDDDVERGQNMLLTFTNIKETLPDTTKIMLDMAQALGTDAGGAAIQLGKALNDPIKGISALTRVGVTFTDAQKKQIKALQEAGDMAGAQRVILAELNKEFGGSALAAAQADGGWAQFTDRLGEAKEALGAAVLPLLNVLVGILNDRLMPALETVADLFGDLVSGGIGVFADDLREAFGVDITPFVTAIEQGLGTIQGLLAPLIATFTDAQTPVQGFLAVLSQISPTFAVAQAGVDAAIGPIRDIILTTFGIIQGFIAEHGAKIQTDLTSAWQQVQAIIQAVIPPIQSIIGSIFGAIAAFLHSHGDEIKTFLSQTWDAIADIIDVALQIIQATIVPAITAIASFIAAHGEEIQALLSAAWTIISNVIDAALTIIKGVLTAALQIIKGDWSGAWETIKQMAADVWENIKAIIGAAIEGVKIQLSLAWDAIKGDVLAAWDAIKGAVGTALDGLVNTIKGLPGQVAGVGASIVQTIWDGLERKWDEFIGNLRAKLQELRDMLPFSDPKDTSSPLYGLAKSGEALVDMMQQGIDRAGPLTIGAPAFAGAGSAASAGVAAAGGPAFGGGGGTGSLTVNVYGAVGQNERQIADMVVREIDRRMRSKK